MPSSAQVPQPSRPSVIWITNFYTEGYSVVVDSLSKKRSSVSDQAKSSVKKFRFNEKVSFSSETSKPISSSKDYCLDTLAKLQKSGKIQVILPKHRSDHTVSAPSTAKNTNTNIQFFDIFVHFAKQFSDDKVENVYDPP